MKKIAVLFLIASFAALAWAQNPAPKAERSAAQAGGPSSTKGLLTLEPLGNGTEALKVIVRGSPYDYGLQMGKTARVAGIRPLMIAKDQKSRQFNTQIAAMYREIYPEHLEEVRGVAAAYGVRADDIDLKFMEASFFNNTCWIRTERGSKILAENDAAAGQEVFSPSACGMVGYKMAHGKMLVGRNFDWPKSNEYVILSKMNGVYKSAGDTFISLNNWMMDGMNEKGLTIGVLVVAVPAEEAKLGNKPYPDVPSVASHHMMRIVLDKCATVEEAVALVKKMNIWFPFEFVHFLVADKAGNAAVLEFDKDGKLLAVKSDKNYLLVTNNYLSGDPALPMQCPRYSKGDKILKTTPIDSADALKEKLMQKITGVDPWPTQWMTVFDLTDQEMNVWYHDDKFATKFSFKMDF